MKKYKINSVIKQFIIILSLSSTVIAQNEPEPKAYKITGNNGKTISIIVENVNADNFSGYIEGTTKKIIVPWSSISLQLLKKNEPELAEKYKLAIETKNNEALFNPTEIFKTEAIKFSKGESLTKRSYTYDTDKKIIVIKEIKSYKGLNNAKIWFATMNKTAGNNDKSKDVRYIYGKPDEFNVMLNNLTESARNLRNELINTPNHKNNIECQKILTRLQNIEEYAPKLSKQYSAVDRDAIIKINEAFEYFDNLK